MIISYRILVSTIFLVTFFVIPLYGEVFAQTEETLEVGVLDTATLATTTETDLSPI